MTRSGFRLKDEGGGMKDDHDPLRRLGFTLKT
jgi:hypothetical protein